MKKVMWKKEIIEQIRADYDYNNPDKYDCTISIDDTGYSRAFDVPYFKVKDGYGEDFYYIEYPKDLKDQCFVIDKNHVEDYKEPFKITIDDKLFEWD